ncbi:MAG TPA: 50S ribosomal protein L28 [Bacteroidia bacterium]|jgi:large subunit ribosomal protein L28|nr:50S ribosomal protein L28 [Bacteroidia bacterium]
MARVCQLTGKKAVGGNMVSHSNHKTKRSFDVNLQRKKFFVPETGEWLTLRVSTSAIKNINKLGVFACVKEAREKGFLPKAKVAKATTAPAAKTATK